jgi:hypothetical protein
VSAWHCASSVSAAHGSGVMHAPAGQAVPSGHSDLTARHSQPALAAHVGSLALAPHASLTTAAGTACVLAWE